VRPSPFRTLLLAPVLPFLPAALVLAASTACDEKSSPAEAHEAAAAAATSTAPPAPEPPRAPDILVDAANVAIGSDHVPTGELGLADKVAMFLTGRPAIEGHTVSLVAMRPAKPSSVVAVVSALRKAKASGAVVHTEARDGSTKDLPLSFATSSFDCAAVAWIAKDAAIDVWPAGGGTPKRVIKGLAGPDMTLGTEAIMKQSGSCNANELFLGADDVLTWGLVFDLGTSALGAPGARASAAVLMRDANLGRKPVID
jgi:hypothetical protein